MKNRSTRHPLEGTWRHMIDRCHNPKAHNYRWYGATGVSVCERWRDSLESFVADVGPRPDGHTLDRFPNKHGNYEPGNVRWAVKLEQANNARNNLLYELDGRTQTLKQWARERGVDYHALYYRVETMGDDVVTVLASLIEGARPQRRDSNAETIVALLSGGCTVAEVVAITGVDQSTIYRYRRERLGIRGRVDR